MCKTPYPRSEEKILGLDIPVDHMLGMAVFQGTRHLQDELQYRGIERRHHIRDPIPTSWKLFATEGRMPARAASGEVCMAQLT